VGLWPTHSYDSYSGFAECRGYNADGIRILHSLFRKER
jgi:hypothetical protein